jgi:hypothetical protein
MSTHADRFSDHDAGRELPDRRTPARRESFTPMAIYIAIVVAFLLTLVIVMSLAT